jgi:hypothetical protein
VVGAGIGQRAATSLTGGKIGAAGVHLGQFPAHDLYNRDTQVRTRPDEILKLRGINEAETGVFERYRGGTIGLSAKSRREPQDTAGARSPHQNLPAVFGVNGQLAPSGTDEIGSAANVSLLEDMGAFGCCD